MNLMTVAKKITALAVTFTFALTPAQSFALDSSSNQQIAQVDGQSVPVQKADTYESKTVADFPFEVTAKDTAATNQISATQSSSPLSAPTTSITINGDFTLAKGATLSADSITINSLGQASSASSLPLNQLSSGIISSTIISNSGSISITPLSGSLSANNTISLSSQSLQLAPITSQSGALSGSITGTGSTLTATKISTEIPFVGPIFVPKDGTLLDSEKDKDEIATATSALNKTPIYKTTVTEDFQCMVAPCIHHTTDTYYNENGKIGSRVYEAGKNPTYTWYDAKDVLITQIKKPEMTDANDYLDEAQKAFKQMPVYQIFVSGANCNGEACTDVMRPDMIQYFDGDKKPLGYVVVTSWQDRREWFGPNGETLSLDERKVNPLVEMNLDSSNIKLDNNGGTLRLNSDGTATITGADGVVKQYKNVKSFNLSSTICTIDGCQTIMASLPENMQKARQIASYTTQQNFPNSKSPERTQVNRMLVYIDESIIRGEEVPEELAVVAEKILGQAPASMRTTPDTVCVMSPCRQGPKTFTFLDKAGNVIGTMVRTITYKGDIEDGDASEQWSNSNGELVAVSLEKDEAIAAAEKLNLDASVLKYKKTELMSTCQGSGCPTSASQINYLDQSGKFLGSKSEVIYQNDTAVIALNGSKAAPQNSGRTEITWLDSENHLIVKETLNAEGQLTSEEHADGSKTIYRYR